jgi:hypothetical protein
MGPAARFEQTANLWVGISFPWASISIAPRMDLPCAFVALEPSPVRIAPRQLSQSTEGGKASSLAHRTGLRATVEAAQYRNPRARVWGAAFCSLWNI